MGIESLLRVRFGEEGLKLMPEIQEIYEEEQLQAILKALETAASPDEVAGCGRRVRTTRWCAARKKTRVNWLISPETDPVRR